jgi:hypothetical protein
MSRWPSDFRDAYAQHPLSAVGMLAAIILAFTFVSVAFAVRFDTPPIQQGTVPASTGVVRPAKGQVPVNPSRPGPAPTTKSPYSVYVPVSPLASATLAPSTGDRKPTPKPSRATSTAVQSPSATATPTPAATTPSASPTAPITTATTTVPAPTGTTSPPSTNPTTDPPTPTPEPS